MSVFQVLSLCNDRAVQLRIEGERLKLIGNEQAIDEQLIALTRAHKTELMELLRTQQLPPGAAALERVSWSRRFEPQPPSFNQQRLWFLHQLGDRAAYNGGVVLEIEGPLNRPALSAAVQQLIDRHECLRTRFVVIDAAPMQQVRRQASIEIDERVLKPGADIDGVLNESVAMPFNLSEDLLLRVALYTRAADRYLLSFVAHHIACDAWSQRILVRDLCDLYRARVAQSRSRLPEQTYQYLDYAVWERARLQGALLEHKLAHWRSYLEGAPAANCLPRDAARRSGGGGEIVAVIEQQLAADLYRALQRLAAAEHTTMFAVLAAAYAGLLAKLSDSADIVFGMPVANRVRAEVEPICGYFSNTVVLRTAVSNAAGFLALLRRTKANLDEVLTEQDVPFDLLVEELKVKRSLALAPVYQLWFSWRDDTHSVPELAGLRLQTRALGKPAARYDLKLEIERRGDALAARWEYDASLYASETIETFSRHFDSYLRAVSAEPDVALGLIELASARRQPIEPADVGIDILERWLALAGQRAAEPAVVTSRGSLSFGVCRDRCERLASLLLDCGIKAGERVGVLCEQSAESLVATLAIWRAGAVCVPLSPHRSSEQLEKIIADAQIHTLLATPDCADSVRVAGIELLVLRGIEDDEWLGQYADQPAARPAAASGDELYVSYEDIASRAVVLTRANVSQYATGLAQRHGMTLGMTYAYNSAPGSSPGDSLLLLAIALGGTLHVVPGESMADLRNAGELLQRAQLDVWQMAPSSLRALWAEYGPLAPRKTLLVSGEALSSSFIHEIRSMLPDPACKAVALYGSAATSFACLTHELTGGGATSQLAPLGRALPGNRAVILQGTIQAPAGAWGELAIAGPCIARSMLARDSNYVAEIGDDDESLGVHRTGQRARIDADGQVMCGGFMDDSAAARGIRLDWGHVESTLREATFVRAAAARIEPSGEVLACAATELTEQELRHRLATNLPGLLLPTAIATVPRLPLDRCGRLDWSAVLSAAAEQRSDAPTAMTQTEGTLRELWQELLNQPQIDASCNFFDSGGHSLLATRLLNRIRARLCEQVELTAIFQYPRLRDLARHIDLQRAVASASLLPAIEGGQELTSCLSFAQQQLWVIDRIEQGSAHYNMVAAYRCRGPLDRDALTDSIKALIERHRVLRTKFEEHDGELRQVVNDVWGLPLATGDLRGLPVEEQERQTSAMLQQEFAHRFSLTAGRLLRATLLTLDEHETVLILNVHHIACDGWSVEILMRELASMYRARVAGVAPDLPVLRVQYTDYARWQRQLLEGDQLQDAVSFWRTQLEGAPLLHDIPMDAPRPAAFDHRGAYVASELDRDRLSQLRQLAAAEGTTLFICLESIVALFFARLGTADDVVIGTPVSGRYHGDLEPLIGLFVNTLPLRHRIGGDQQFLEVLAESRQAASAAFSRQHCPFEVIVDALGIERSLAYNPIFQLVFALKDEASRRVELPGVVATALERTAVEAKFDLMLSATETTDGLRLEWQYATALFERETVELMAAQFDTLVASILAKPTAPIAELSLISEADRRIINGADSAAAESAEDMYACFVQAAQRRPQAIAVADGTTQVSYQELHRAAETAAEHLLARGIRAGDRIALYLPRGLPFIACMLGSLRIGAIYVPIDSSSPPARIQRILADAEPALVIAPEELQGDLPDTVARATPAQLDQDIASSGERVRVDPEAAAYVMYTSGSTGAPKGVIVPHRAIHRLVRKCSFMPLSAATVMLHLAPVAFDAATFEIWGPLANGGTVVSHARQGVELAQLADFLVQHRVNSMWLTAALFEQWVAQLDRPLPDLRFVLAGGDVVPPAAVRRLYDLLPQVTIINGYGPTENTTFTCCYVIPRDWPADRAVPIGQPISGTSVYVLDDWRAPRPVGAIGELYAAGQGLALGYWRNETLTHTAFVRNTDGQLLYRTGDLVRRDCHGVLHYLGRRDAQVKIRGYRVEPGEVERCLAEESGIADVCAAVLGEDRKLVAYFTRIEQTAQSTEALRDALRRRARGHLPAYMVPVAFVELAALPLSANGKLDRRALPSPAKEDFTSTEYAATEGALEQLLAQVWTHLLGVENVGAHDDFFALGGNSLLATRLASAVEAKTGVRVPLREVFQRRSIRQLANWLDAQPAPAQVATLRRVDGNGPFEVSYAQQRLWFIDRLDGGSSQYNMPALFELEGTLDPHSLQSAVDLLAERHEVLRATYAELDGAAVQIVATSRSHPIQHHDLRGLAPADRLERAEALLKKEARAPFDLERGPIFRVTLVQLADDEYRLLLNMHHIASDGWSVAVTIRDLMSFYAALVQGHAVSLPEPPIRYADYAQWQRAELSAQRREELVRYWRQKLDGIAPLHSLPTDRPRPPRISHNGGTIRTRLSPSLTAQVKALATANGTSLFTFLQATFALLLARIGGERDIVIGTPVAGRERVELESLVGCFVNTLVLRNQVPEHASFTDYLAQAQAMVLNAMEHQQLPFDLLVEGLQPERSPSHLPVFQIWFVLQNMEIAALALPGLEVIEVSRDDAAAKFDLMLSATEREGGISLNWVYNSDLFETATIQSWSESFEVLIQAIVARAQEDVSLLPLLSPTQAAEIERCAYGDSIPTVQQTLLEQFRRTAALHGDRIAVRYLDGSLTYAQLAQRAERLAGYLLDLGVGPGATVGICCERSLELPIAVLGVWHAGAAFVPLDPRSPRERLAYIVQDTGAQLLLVSREAADLFELSKTDLLVLDGAGRDERWLEEFAEAADRSRVDALAYVIYTSGTSGRPKGVMISHASLTNLIAGLKQVLADHGCGGALRWAWNAPLVFDASLQALAQLTVGGELHLLCEQTRATPSMLAGYLQEHAIDLLDCTPSTLELILLEARRRDTALPHLLVGGEPINAQQWLEIADAMARHGRVALNVYGPTEATVDATYAPIRREESPNIGRPLPNVEIRVLDENLLELPRGAIGECYIAGPGLAQGYVNRPELSAEKFVMIALGGRWTCYYRTGDLTRWIAGGALSFLGRRDTQVKLRGYRVELGEIEQVMLAISEVSAAAVVLSPRTQALVAYFVWSGSGEGADEVEAQCRRQLPQYMVPAAFLRIERLPLTANGKVDLRALPEPGDTDDALLLPSTPTQQVLQTIWQRLLAREPIAVNVNFFMLGGHSLLAVRLISAVREEFGCELPLAALFEHPTIAALAARIDVTARKRRFPKIERAAAGTVPPMSHAQHRLWLIDNLEGGSSQYNMPAAFHLDGALNIDACRSSIVRIVERHEVLRTSYDDADGRAVQRVRAQSDVPFDLVDLSRVDVSERAAAVQAIVREDALRPFDLRGDCMLRVKALRLADDQHVLVFNMHHIASDGWSITILIKEFLDGYAALSAGRDYRPAPLPIQYADYALWQRRVLTTEAFENDLVYWREQLRALPQVHSLPLDKPRPTRQTYGGELITRQLSQATLNRLEALSLRSDVTLFVTLQTIFAALLARWSNESDIAIGTPIAGRDEQNLEPLIGFFLNTIVIRNDLGGNPSFSELLGRARRAVQAALEHQAVPFEMLIETLRPERSLSHAPLFQIMFVLQNQEHAAFELPDLRIAPVERPVVVAKFDLLLNARETAEGLELSWIYNRDLFEAETIERMADGFEQIVAHVQSDCSAPLAALELLREPELNRIVYDWNDTRLPLAYEHCLHELFIRKAAETPDSLAVIDADRELSYRQLLVQAEALSRRLDAYIVEPETLIAVLLPKGRGQLIATLAIMMAGAAYLPLDTQWPKPRCAQILEHGRAPALVTLPGLIDGLSSPAQPIFFDAIEPEPAADFEALCQRSLRVPVRPRSLAYVIFTSGSTGAPKGVAIEHRSAVNTVLDINQRYEVGARDSLLAVSALSFDLSVYDMFGLLAAGGTVVFPEDARQKDPAHWAELVERHRITLWDTVPASAELLTAHYEYRQLRSHGGLRLVMMSGDWIPPSLPRRLWAVFESAQVHSLGGATEGSIWSISYPILADTSHRRSVPYGRPLANQMFYVLTESLQPCPIGVAGQLHIGGIGVAREYYRDPARTAKSFVEHPRLGRLYCTGDIGRYLPDGNIEFIGRKDGQVKIRGFRIELGEIEAALAAQSEVERAVVQVLHDPTEVQQLVAYLTLEERAVREQLSASALRNRLAAVLPSYMVPAYYVRLDEWPLSANNKIERSRLPPPEWRVETHDVREPTDAMQQLLLQLWQQVLGRTRIGIDHNFFEIGGTSVHLIEIANKASLRLEREIPVVRFFEHPTIEALARHLSPAQATPASPVSRAKGRLAELRARRQ